MEKFNEKIENFKSLSQKDKDEKIKEIIKICRDFCGKCPSYIKTEEKEFGFCIKGRSEIIEFRKDCLCEKCPVSKEFGFKWSYYCIEGKAETQKRKLDKIYS